VERLLETNPELVPQLQRPSARRQTAPSNAVVRMSEIVD
jgi:hypothetical protein